MSSAFTWPNFRLRHWRACLFLVACLVISLDLTSRSVAAEYRLSAGDALTFDFLDDTEQPVTAIITPTGEAHFPFIGGVNVTGLTIPEALGKLEDEYRAREILVDPKLSLDIASFRPIFVLGEVRNPGSFPFFGGVTVEQAIGLAGGTLVVAANASDRIISRARLRGDVEAATAEIVHEAIYAARLVAQSKTIDRIDLNDVPEIARQYVNGVPLEGIIELEEKILKADLTAKKSQEQVLAEGITQSEDGIGILNELVAYQRKVIENGEEDLARIADLRKRGLATENDLSRAENAESTEKARLLEIFATLSRSRQEASDLRLQLARLAADREKEILTQLQEREIAIKKIIARKRAAEEQILLMAALNADEAKKNEISYTYEVRRKSVDGTPTSMQAFPLTELLPGDVLLVGISGMD